MATELTPRQKLLVEMAQAASVGNLDRFADDVLRYRKFRAFTISMDNEAGLQPQTPEEFDAVVDGMAEPASGVTLPDGAKNG